MADRVNVAEGPPSGLSNYETEQIYNGLDCMVTLEVAKELRSEVAADLYARTTYAREMGKYGVCTVMSLSGLYVNPVRRAELIQAMEKSRADAERRFMRLVAGFEWFKNIRSPEQLKRLFYEELGVKQINDPKTGNPTVNLGALEKIQKHSPAVGTLCAVLRAYREFKKPLEALKSTIVNNRMRTFYSPVATETGRWSSTKSAFGDGDNLQNWKKSLREIFSVERPRRKKFSVDLKQAEARIVAYLSGDEQYIQVCESSDLHTGTCKMAWPEVDWPDDPKAAKELADAPGFYRHFSRRDLSKRFGHGSNYAGSAYGIAAAVGGVEPRLVEEFQERYFSAFPGIAAWHDWVAEQIQLNKFLVTPFLRRRWFLNRVTDLSTIKEAIAYVPQSTDTDYLDHALIRFWRFCQEQACDDLQRDLHADGIRIERQDHDSFGGEFPEEQEALVRSLLDRAFSFSVPVKDINGRTRNLVLPIEVKFGWNYAEAYFNKSTQQWVNEFGLMEYAGEDTREFRWTKPNLLAQRLS